MHQFGNSFSRRHGVSALLVLTFLSLLVSVPRAYAEITDHGGSPERFKGAGDKQPPRCQIDIPRAATEPFFVKWNCSDNFAERDHIQTELWIYRSGAERGVLLSTFLGFPASVLIDEGILEVESFTDGLPVGFRLLARDRAGISTISPLITVRAQDNELDSCTLTVVTQATDSTGSTTGVPALTVKAANAPVTTQEISSSQLRIVTPASVKADPCDIDSLCSEDEQVAFSASITLDDTGAASGTVDVLPGALVADVTGTAEVENAVLSDLEVTGTATIDGVPATVGLVCVK